MSEYEIVRVIVGLDIRIIIRNALEGIKLIEQYKSDSRSK